VSAVPRAVTGELLEREGELARIDRALGRLSAGSGGVIVVEGPAGIGKSELMVVARARAHARGIGSLAARGSEFEADFAFGVARQVLEPMVRGASAKERRRLVDGVARVGARALGLVAGEPPADQLAAIHGLFWLCANRAERDPLLLLVDDVQWIDDPSLGWLAYLARRVGDLPLLLVLGSRTGAPGSDRDELALLVADRGTERVPLPPLSAAAVATIVRAQLDPAAAPGFCAACSELTGGNPLFVHELMVAAREEAVPAQDGSVAALERIAPAAIGPSVLTRLDRLGPDAVALARAVAVLGPGAEVLLAACLAGLAPAGAELVADRLAEAQILAAVRPLEFFHPLVGACVLDEIPPGARRLAHRRAGALLHEHGGSLERVAAHLLASGPGGDGWVAAQLHRAAESALQRGAPEIAAGYARRALAEPPAAHERSALLLLLGTSEWRAGQPGAIGHLEESLAAEGQDPGAIIGASALLAVAYNVTDQPERAVEVLERTLPLLSGGGGSLPLPDRRAATEPELLRDPGVAVMLEAAIAMVGMVNERTAPAALQRAEALRPRLAALEQPPVYLLVTLANYALRANDADTAQDLAERALACRPYPPPLDVCLALTVALTLVESYDALQGLCDDVLAVARRRGAMQEAIAIHVARATALADRGALADAEADARWVLERGQGVRRVHALTENIRVLLERDELDEAAELFDAGPGPGSSRSIEMIRFLLVRGRLRAAQRRFEDALADFQECARRCAGLGLPTLSATPWRAEAALVEMALGNAAEARCLAGEQLTLARAFGRPRTLGMALRASGLVEGGQAGHKLLAEAVATLERSQSPIELARARSDLGAALRRLDQRAEARVELERALDLAHRLGARRIAHEARAELIAAGAKPRRDATTGQEALTISERRVARLAANGLSNREVAQALFITTATAKTHLRHAYRKLGITRRDQLAEALASPAKLGGARRSASAPIS
jgi:DNA-binding CsgD family transcriptional regulator